jgi:hypothetical protein
MGGLKWVVLPQRAAGERRDGRWRLGQERSQRCSRRRPVGQKPLSPNLTPALTQKCP